MKKKVKKEASPRKRQSEPARHGTKQNGKYIKSENVLVLQCNAWGGIMATIIISCASFIERIQFPEKFRFCQQTKSL